MNIIFILQRNWVLGYLQGSIYTVLHQDIKRTYLFLIWRWFWYRKMNLSLILFMLCVEKTRLMYKSIFYFSHEREEERMNSRHPNHFSIWPCFWNYFETRQSKRGSWLIGLHVPITQKVPTYSMQSTYQYTPTLKPHWES